MTGRRPRGRRGALRGRGLSRGNFRAAITRENKRVRSGTKFTPSPDPPTLVSVPWNNIVVAVVTTMPTDGSWVSIRASTIVAALIAQAGLYPGETVANPTPPEIRIQRVSAWNMSGGSLMLQASDLQEPQDPWHESLVQDWPGRNHWARVGFAWSAADCSVVFKHDSDTEIIKLTAPKDSEIVIHIQIVWRSQQTPQLPGLDAVLTPARFHQVSDPVVLAVEDLSNSLRHCVIQIE